MPPCVITDAAVCHHGCLRVSSRMPPCVITDAAVCHHRSRRLLSQMPRVWSQMPPCYHSFLLLIFVASCVTANFLYFLNSIPVSFISISVVLLQLCRFCLLFVSPFAAQQAGQQQLPLLFMFIVSVSCYSTTGRTTAAPFLLLFTVCATCCSTTDKITTATGTASVCAYCCSTTGRITAATVTASVYCLYLLLPHYRQDNCSYRHCFCLLFVPSVAALQAG